MDLDSQSLSPTLNFPSSVHPLDLVLRVVPTKPIAAAAERDMLAIIFFSLAFGICLNCFKGKSKIFLSKVCENFFQVLMEMTGVVILIAPIGVF